MTAEHDPLAGDPITEIALRLTAHAPDVAQLDVSELLSNPDFWDKIAQFAFRLGGMVNHYNRYWTVWHELPPGVKALVLQDRVGEVLAFGQRCADAGKIFYLIISPTGLEFRPALTQQQIDDANETTDVLEEVMLSAMERQRSLFAFMATWIQETHQLNELGQHLLYGIRQTLWELLVRKWAPTERLARLNTIAAAFAAIAQDTAQTPEDLLQAAREARSLS